MADRRDAELLCLHLLSNALRASLHDGRLSKRDIGANINFFMNVPVTPEMCIRDRVRTIARPSGLCRCWQTRPAAGISKPSSETRCPTPVSYTHLYWIRMHWNYQVAFANLPVLQQQDVLSP